MTAQDPRQAVAAYYRAWKEKDFAALRSVLADDANFRGPLGRADDAETCVKGLEGMSRIVTDVVVKRMFADGRDVLTWFDLHTSVAGPVPTASWTRVGEDGRITRVRAVFDPRPLTTAQAG